ncbi:unnamed protein product [Gadus morhua 'NCC']
MSNSITSITSYITTPSATAASITTTTTTTTSFTTASSIPSTPSIISYPKLNHHNLRHHHLNNHLYHLQSLQRHHLSPQSQPPPPPSPTSITHLPRLHLKPTPPPTPTPTTTSTKPRLHYHQLNRNHPVDPYPASDPPPPPPPAPPAVIRPGTLFRNAAAALHLFWLLTAVHAEWLSACSTEPRWDERSFVQKLQLGPELLHRVPIRRIHHVHRGNTLCKTGSTSVFGNVVYTGLLNDHLWHLGVPLFTRLTPAATYYLIPEDACDWLSRAGRRTQG